MQFKSQMWKKRSSNQICDGKIPNNLRNSENEKPATIYIWIKSHK